MSELHKVERLNLKEMTDEIPKMKKHKFTATPVTPEGLDAPAEVSAATTRATTQSTLGSLGSGPALTTTLTSASALDRLQNEEYQRNRNENNQVFKKYYLIRDAVKLSDMHHNLPIYAFDKPNPKNPGAKWFYVGSYSRFWNYYVSLNPDERCFYETILPDQLCHLYADIEGMCQTNPNVNLPQLYSSLIAELQAFMINQLPAAKGNPVRCIELDSSTSKKFSKHCIFKIQGCYFRNNYHCGAFMRQFQKHLLEKYGLPSTGANPFFIWSEKEKDFTDPLKKVLFIDLGVYTLRRQFRLIGSSKRCTPRRFMFLDHSPQVLQKKDFFDCLIQYVPDVSNVTTIFEINEPDGSEPSSCSLRTFDDRGNPISIAANQHPRQPLNLSPEPLAISQSTLLTSGFTAVTPTTVTQSAAKVKLDQVNDNSATLDTSSYLPAELQTMFKDYFKTNFGYEITSYTIRGDHIHFDTNDTRCMNKKRKTGEANHRSNHVYFVVYPMTKFHFQGCYDDNYCKEGSKKSVTPLGDKGKITNADLIAKINDWWFKCNNTWGTI